MALCSGTAVTGAVSVNPGNVILEVFSCLSTTLVDTGCDQNSSTRQFLGLLVYKQEQAQTIASPMIWRNDDGSQSSSPAARVSCSTIPFLLDNAIHIFPSLRSGLCRYRFIPIRTVRSGTRTYREDSEGEAGGRRCTAT